MRYVICGLSITSSWGNGHATTYRALMKELSSRGHDVLFLERETPWYAANRDLPEPPFGTTRLYASLAELKRRHERDVRDADVVVLGSYVPEGIEIGRWVTRVARGLTAFYDIDTPITLAALANGGASYLDRKLVGRFDLYLSFTGGPTLERLEREFGARAARPLYCSVDATLYYPERRVERWALGYLGTYSEDRQPALRELLLDSAARLPRESFVVAGAQYPATLTWPENLRHIVHISPDHHRAFYAAQRFTLNLTRTEMARAGYSPSVRLFEAAACGVPIISDTWPGLETLFRSGREILLARSAADVVGYLRELPEAERLALATRARDRILRRHTAAHRAAELDGYVCELLHQRPSRPPPSLGGNLAAEEAGESTL